MARARLDVQIDAAVGLLSNYAELFPVALHHIDRELRAFDGYGAGRTFDGMPQGEAELTSVERNTEARMRLSAVRSQLTDDRDAILSLVASALRVARDAVGTRAPVAVARCRDNQIGRAGAIEWGRATCEELPAKSGLCSGCYWRETRWRRLHGMGARDVVPVA